MLGFEFRSFNLCFVVWFVKLVAFFKSDFSNSYYFFNKLYNNKKKIACDIEEATCRNGQCIPRSGLCDGRIDCSDGSDESQCGGNLLENIV